MIPADAKALIEKGVSATAPQRWADLGCGSGTFTIALNSILPEGSQLVAVDKQAQNLPVEFIKANFEKDELKLSGLDSILMANSLHFIKHKAILIQKLESYFAAEPTFLIVEYDTNSATPWVPYPMSFVELQRLFQDLGYKSISKLGEQQSIYSRSKIYSALLQKR
jgi:trans-aconitate methyltransferase